MGPHKHGRKRMISSSSSNNSSSGDGTSDKESYKKRLKHKTPNRNDSSSKKELEETRKSRKIKVSKEHSEKKIRKEKRKQKHSRNKCTSPELPSNDIPLHFMEKSKSMAPMTKDEWDKKQSVIQKVYDESTGRHRLIKGDGEVIEEIVSRERHIAINQHATRGDGDHFQNTLSTLLKK